MKELVKVFDQSRVRIINRNGEFLFHALDCARALGYKNEKDAVAKKVDKSSVVFIDNSRGGKTHTLGEANNGGRLSNFGANYLTEAGLYELIFTSKLESAKGFKRWVFEDVLPALRKTGSYTTIKAPDWSLERLVSKLGYKSMCGAIALSKENPATYDYSNNADLINRIVLGMGAKQYRELNELGKSTAIRDEFEAQTIFIYSRLQFENERLIIEGVDFQDRKSKLKALHTRLSQGLLPKTEKKPQLSLIINNM